VADSDQALALFNDFSAREKDADKVVICAHAITTNVSFLIGVALNAINDSAAQIKKDKPAKRAIGQARKSVNDLLKQAKSLTDIQDDDQRRVMSREEVKSALKILADYHEGAKIVTSRLPVVGRIMNAAFRDATVISPGPSALEDLPLRLVTKYVLQNTSPGTT